MKKTCVLLLAEAESTLFHLTAKGWNIEVINGEKHNATPMYKKLPAF